MSTRTSRVEELLRREIADLLLRGEFRDPRLNSVAEISITGVRVSADLSVARVFVDVLGTSAHAQADVVAALNSAAGLFRSHVSRKVRLRRTPTLRFEGDESIERGANIERVLAELAAERTPHPVDPASPNEKPDEDPEGP